MRAAELLIQSESELSVIDKVVVSILLSTGCRISEALAVRQQDIILPFKVRIKGKKGSADGIYTIIKGDELLQHLHLNGNSIGELRNRFYYYRLFKAKGIYGKFGENKKLSVTHYFRHETTLNNKNQGVTTIENQKLLRHQNRENTNIYEQE